MTKFLATFALLGLLCTPAFAMDLTNEKPTQNVEDARGVCQTVLAEAADARSAGFSFVREIVGEELVQFLNKAGAPPELAQKIDKIIFATKPGTTLVGVVLVKNDCVLGREFFEKALIENWLGTPL